MNVKYTFILLGYLLFTSALLAQSKVEWIATSATTQWQKQKGLKTTLVSGNADYAKRVNTEGVFNNLLAFVNPDKSIAILVQNDSNDVKNVHIKIGDKTINPSLKPNTINTFLIKL